MKFLRSIANWLTILFAVLGSAFFALWWRMREQRDAARASAKRTSELAQGDETTERLRRERQDKLKGIAEREVAEVHKAIQERNERILATGSAADEVNRRMDAREAQREGHDR